MPREQVYTIIEASFSWYKSNSVWVFFFQRKCKLVLIMESQILVGWGKVDKIIIGETFPRDFQRDGMFLSF